MANVIADLRLASFGGMRESLNDGEGKSNCSNKKEAPVVSSSSRSNERSQGDLARAFQSHVALAAAGTALRQSLLPSPKPTLPAIMARYSIPVASSASGESAFTESDGCSCNGQESSGAGWPSSASCDHTMATFSPTSERCTGLSPAAKKTFFGSWPNYCSLTAKYPRSGIGSEDENRRVERRLGAAGMPHRSTLSTSALSDDSSVSSTSSSESSKPHTFGNREDSCGFHHHHRKRKERGLRRRWVSRAPSSDRTTSPQPTEPLRAKAIAGLRQQCSYECFGSACDGDSSSIALKSKSRSEGDVAARFESPHLCPAEESAAECRRAAEETSPGMESSADLSSFLPNRRPHRGTLKLPPLISPETSCLESACDVWTPSTIASPSTASPCSPPSSFQSTLVTCQLRPMSISDTNLSGEGMSPRLLDSLQAQPHCAEASPEQLEADSDWQLPDAAASGERTDPGNGGVDAALEVASSENVVFRDCRPVGSLLRSAKCDGHFSVVSASCSDGPEEASGPFDADATTPVQAAGDDGDGNTRSGPEHCELSVSLCASDERVQSQETEDGANEHGALAVGSDVRDAFSRWDNQGSPPRCFSRATTVEAGGMSSRGSRASTITLGELARHETTQSGGQWHLEDGAESAVGGDSSKEKGECSGAFGEDNGCRIVRRNQLCLPILSRTAGVTPTVAFQSTPTSKRTGQQWGQSEAADEMVRDVEGRQLQGHRNTERVFRDLGGQVPTTCQGSEEAVPTEENRNEEDVREAVSESKHSESLRRSGGEALRGSHWTSGGTEVPQPVDTAGLSAMPAAVEANDSLSVSPKGSTNLTANSSCSTMRSPCFGCYSPGFGASPADLSLGCDDRKCSPRNLDYRAEEQRDRSQLPGYYSPCDGNSPEGSSCVSFEILLAEATQLDAGNSVVEPGAECDYHQSSFHHDASSIDLPSVSRGDVRSTVDYAGKPTNLGGGSGCFREWSKSAGDIPGSLKGAEASSAVARGEEEISSCGLAEDYLLPRDSARFLLGLGNFGRVVLARSRVTNEACAVKSIAKSGRSAVEIGCDRGSVGEWWSAGAGGALPFGSDDARCTVVLPAIGAAETNEIKIMRRVQGHDCVMELRGAYEDDRNVHLVMEYCRGGDLLQHLQQDGPMTETNAKIVLHQLLGALEHIHARGVVHRDVKPENLVFCHPPESSLRLKLVDFGTAFDCCDQRQMPVERCGSPGYAAPEVLRGVPYGSKCDMWSAGVVLYAMLTGEHLNVGEAYAGNLKLSSLPPGLSEDCLQMLISLLSPCPQDRPSAAAALQKPWMTNWVDL